MQSLKAVSLRPKIQTVSVYTRHSADCSKQGKHPSPDAFHFRTPPELVKVYPVDSLGVEMFADVSPFWGLGQSALAALAGFGGVWAGAKLTAWN